MRNGWVGVAIATRIATWMLTGIAIAAIAGCKRDPSAVEAERAAADKMALDQAVLLDVKLDAVLQKADGFAAKGEDARAATTLSDEALPAADRAFEAASALHPSTTWGTERARELTDLARARRDSLPAYVAALRGDDLAAKLAATETQVKLEQQAMGVLAHLNGQDAASAAENDSPLDAGAGDAHL